jgi:hypothetical protein
MDPLFVVAFFEQCQTANKADGVLDKLKEKKQPKEKKMAHLPVAYSHGSNHRHHPLENHKYYQATNAIATNANTIVAIKMIVASTTLVIKRRASRKSPARTEMTRNTITSKRRMWSCTTTTPLL